MGSEIDMVFQVSLNRVKVSGDTISLSACNEIEKSQNMFLCRQLGGKNLNILSYHGRNMWSTRRGTSHAKTRQVYTKVKDMLDHRLPNKLGT